MWAWAAAELVAYALGHASSPPPPAPFAEAVSGLPDATGLVDPALRALDRIEDPARSEIAELWSLGHEGSLLQHLQPLRERLRPARPTGDPQPE